MNGRLDVDLSAEALYNGGGSESSHHAEGDRAFWLAIREALLLAVRAIEDRHGLRRSHQTKREQR